MPNYTEIFTRLGAFGRLHAQCRAIADTNFAVTQDDVTLRTPGNLADALLEAFDGERPALQGIAALDALRASARATGSAGLLALSRWLATELASELGVQQSAGEALRALARAMEQDDESIAACEVSLTQPAPAPGNHGNGVASATLLAASPANATLADSQLARSQQLALICVADSVADPTLHGREEWLLLAGSGRSLPAYTIPVTAGDSQDPRNLVIDGSFTEFDSGFAHWAAAGDSDFTQSTTVSLFHDTALRVNGSGAGSLRQVISQRADPLPGGRLLALGAWFKVTAVTAGTVTLRLEHDGNPLTSVLQVDDATAAGEWLHLSGWVLLPHLAPGEELELVVLTSADFSGDVAIDGVSLAVADGPLDGVSVAIVQGPTPFSSAPLADRFSWETESDDAGAFVVFLRDAFGIEVPVSDTPSIDDSLAI